MHVAEYNVNMYSPNVVTSSKERQRHATTEVIGNFLNSFNHSIVDKYDSIWGKHSLFMFFFLLLNLILIKLWERQTMSIARVVRCSPLQGSSLSKQGTWHCVVLVNVTGVQKWAWSEGEDKGKVVSAAGTGQASRIMDPHHWTHLKCTPVWRLVFDRQSMNWVNNCSQWP